MRLRRERKRAKLTQQELARFAGVDQSTVSKLETGKLIDPSFAILDKLATCLQKCGRRVQAFDLQPKRQLNLVKDLKVEPKRKRTA